MNRSPERGRALVELLNERTPTSAKLADWSSAFRVPEGTDIIVNATSIGLFPHLDAQLDIELDTLQPAMVVADIIPNPPRTRLIQEAERRGCRVLDGLDMLVNQGVIGIKYWTGVNVDANVMRRTLAGIFSAS